MVCTRVKLIRIAPQTEARRGLVSTAIFLSFFCHHVGCLSCCSFLYDKPFINASGSFPLVSSSTPAQVITVIFLCFFLAILLSTSSKSVLLVFTASISQVEPTLIGNIQSQHAKFANSGVSPHSP